MSNVETRRRVTLSFVWTADDISQPCLACGRRTHWFAAVRPDDLSECPPPDGVALYEACLETAERASEVEAGKYEVVPGFEELPEGALAPSGPTVEELPRSVADLKAFVAGLGTGSGPTLDELPWLKSMGDLKAVVAELEPATKRLDASAIAFSVVKLRNVANELIEAMVELGLATEAPEGTDLPL